MYCFFPRSFGGIAPSHSPSPSAASLRLTRAPARSAVSLRRRRRCEWTNIRRRSQTSATDSPCCSSRALRRRPQTSATDRSCCSSRDLRLRVRFANIYWRRSPLIQEIIVYSLLGAKRRRSIRIRGGDRSMQVGGMIGSSLCILIKPGTISSSSCFGKRNWRKFIV